MRAFEQENYGHAIAHCSKSYEQTRAEDDLLRLAESQTRAFRYEDALASYEKVPRSHLAEKSLFLLEYALVSEHHHQSAFSLIDEMQRGFETAGNTEGLAKAFTARSQLYWKRGDLARALEAAETSLRLVVHGDFEETTIYRAHTARIDALRRMGKFEAAKAAIRSSLELKLEDCNRAWFHLREAMLYGETDDRTSAFQILEGMESSAKKCPDPRLIAQVLSNLAWLHYGEREYDISQKYLNRVVEILGGRDFDDLLLRALIAARNKDWKAAKQFLDDARETTPYDDDWQWELKRAFAELAEESGDLGSAEKYYRDAIVDVMFIRREVKGASAYYLASHRAPFEGLIGLLSRQNRWMDVLEVVQLMDSSDMLAPNSSSPAGVTVELGDDEKARRKNFQLVRDPQGAAAIMAAWSQGRELSIVVALSKREIGEDKERVYRIIVGKDGIHGEDVGTSRDVRRWIADLDSGDWDKRNAKDLSKVFVPPGSSTTPLTVLGVGELGKVRLGALEDEDGSLTASRRSLLRTFSLREELPTPKFTDARVVLAADSNGAIPRVAEDAAAAATALGLNGKAGVVKRYGVGTNVPATRERLAEAKSADVLYIAAHSGEKSDSRTVALDDDEPVTVEELQALELAPRFAVLAICESARATDEEGRNSVAATLVKQGSERVLATNYKVNDGATQVFMGALVKQPDWLSAPEVALARVQQEAAKTGQLNGVKISRALWSSFVVIARAPYLPATETASLQKQP